jgi:hypothetical protein
LLLGCADQRSLVLYFEYRSGTVSANCQANRAYLASLSIKVHEEDEGLLAALRGAALNPSDVDVVLPEVLKDLLTTHVQSQLH